MAPTSCENIDAAWLDPGCILEVWAAATATAAAFPRGSSPALFWVAAADRVLFDLSEEECVDLPMRSSSR